MADAGEYAEFVDSGNVKITNDQSLDEFKQLFNIQIFIDTPMTKHQRTDSVLEKLFDLRDFAIEADIYLTEPELQTWVALTVQTDNKPPNRQYTVTFTGDNAAATTITGDFYLTQLHFISPEEGYSTYHIRLESDDGGVATT